MKGEAHHTSRKIASCLSYFLRRLLVMLHLGTLNEGQHTQGACSSRSRCLTILVWYPKADLNHPRSSPSIWRL